MKACPASSFSSSGKSGLLEGVAVITASVFSSSSAALTAIFTVTPGSAARSFSAKGASFSVSASYIHTSLTPLRAAQPNCACQKPCAPVPTSPREPISARAVFLIPAPPTAPVRSAVTILPSSRAFGSPVFASKSITAPLMKGSPFCGFPGRRVSSLQPQASGVTQGMSMRESPPLSETLERSGIAKFPSSAKSIVRSILLINSSRSTVSTSVFSLSTSNINHSSFKDIYSLECTDLR